MDTTSRIPFRGRLRNWAKGLLHSKRRNREDQSPNAPSSSGSSDSSVKAQFDSGLESSDDYSADYILVKSPAESESAEATKSVILPRTTEFIEELSHPEFIYDPLPHGQWVRFIRVLPGERDDPVSVELFCCSLDKAPSYEAISYVWGDPTDQKEIICNKKSHLITRNLYSALQIFRLKDQPRVLWADAVCIDQNNDMERGHQVNFMGAIFCNAEKVLAWLGESGSDEAKVARGFEYMNEVVSYFLENADQIRSNYPPNSQQTDVRRIVRAINFKPQDDSSNLRAVDFVFRNSYFKRVWILQEVMFGRTVDVYYGDIFMALSTLVTYNSINSIKKDANHRLRFGGRVSDAFWYIWSTSPAQDTWVTENTLLPEYAAYIRRKRVTSFSDIVDTGRKFEASDKRDYIYAFLGHPTAKIGQDEKLILDADYSIDIPQLNVIYSTQMVVKTGTLVHLETMYHPNREALELDSPLLSWVRDWNPKKIRTKRIPLSRDKILKAIDYQPSTFIDSQNRLHTIGLVIDTVSFCTSQNFGPKVDFSTEKNVFEECWDELKKEMPDVNILDFTRLYVSVGWRELDHPSRRKLRDLREFAKQKCTEDFHSEIEEVWKTHRDDSERGSVRRFLSTLKMYYRTRRVFLTESDEVGLGPRLMQKGDICCTIFGSRCMSIIRPTGEENTYKLIGVCTVSGLMDGTIGRRWQSGVLQQQEIILA
jgi:hypothetical protein